MGGPLPRPRRQSTLDLYDNTLRLQLTPIADYPASTSSPAATDAPNGLDQLKKLAELHAAGILTDAEFSAAKAKALGL